MTSHLKTVSISLVLKRASGRNILQCQIMQNTWCFHAWQRLQRMPGVCKKAPILLSFHVFLAWNHSMMPVIYIIESITGRDDCFSLCLISSCLWGMNDIIHAPKLWWKKIAPAKEFGRGYCIFREKLWWVSCFFCYQSNFSHSLKSVMCKFYILSYNFAFC